MVGIANNFTHSFVSLHNIKIGKCLLTTHETFNYRAYPNPFKWFQEERVTNSYIDIKLDIDVLGTWPDAVVRTTVIGE